MPYLWKLAWVVGLFLLVMISFDIENQIDSYSNTNYDIIPKIWANFFIHFIWGVYLSLLFIKEWNFQVNRPLLICVFLPCILFSLNFPMSALTSLYIPLGDWTIKVITSGLIEIVAGLTLMLSIFNNKKSDNI